MLMKCDWFEQWYNFWKKKMHYQYRVDWHYVPDIMWEIFGRGKIDGWWLGWRVNDVIRRDEQMTAVKSIVKMHSFVDGFEEVREIV